jgi:hypothetical protein
MVMQRPGRTGVHAFVMRLGMEHIMNGLIYLVGLVVVVVAVLSFFGLR